MRDLAGQLRVAVSLGGSYKKFMGEEKRAGARLSSWCSDRTAQNLAIRVVSERLYKRCPQGRYLKASSSLISIAFDSG
jgi:hypothetical protein